jgi:hypothetical protein
MEEGGMSQGMQAASVAGKGQKIDFLAEPPERNTTKLTLQF